MTERKIFSLGREKYLLSYTFKGFKQRLGNSNKDSWVYISPEPDFAVEKLLNSGLSNQDQVACLYLALNEDWSLWLQNNPDRFEGILSKFSRVVFCINPFQLKELSSLLNNINFGKINPELEIILDAVVALNDSEKRLPDHAVFLIKEAIILSRGIAHSYFTFRTTPENCFWADDINNLFSDNDQGRLFFYPSRIFLSGGPGKIPVRRETSFHHLMFYDDLSRQKSISLANRLFYKRLTAVLEGKNIYDLIFQNKKEELKITDLGNGFVTSNFPVRQSGTKLVDDLLFADFEHLFLPRFTELFTLTHNYFKGKLNKIFAGPGSYKIQNDEVSIPGEVNAAAWKHVLITGWYGTETNGDKAIVGEVLHFIKTCSPQCKITLTSIYPKISIQTNFELKDLEAVQLISIHEKDFFPCVRDVDAVIMGGGPIMETAEMINVLRLFEEANRQKKARIIFGCGIGPFHSQKIIDVTKRVLELTTAGFVRDKESWEYAGRLYPDHVLGFACDPAIAFIYRWKKNYIKRNGALPARKKNIACLLRANTNEFEADQSPDRLEQINRGAAKQIGDFLEPVCRDLDYQAILLHMNAPWIGGDDRLFNRLVEERFLDENKVKNERRYLELDEHLERLLTTDVALAMRYHGHIFCLALGIPFVSIDYTGKKGKVSSLISRIDYSGWSEDWSGMQSERAAERLKKLIVEREQISLFLDQEAGKLVALLYQTYSDIFKIKIEY